MKSAVTWQLLARHESAVTWIVSLSYIMLSACKDCNIVRIVYMNEGYFRELNMPKQLYIEG